MRYLSKMANGRDTRNAFVRSMDVARAPDLDKALENYCSAWFSSKKKQYVNEAFKHASAKSLFWPAAALHDMLDEIAMSIISDEGCAYDAKKFYADLDRLKSKITLWSSPRKSRTSREDVQKEIRSFEAKYRYPCPDTFKSCWMNSGAYIALSYDIKYEKLLMPGCGTQEESLGLLKKLALEIIADRDHDVDTRLFAMCHALYRSRYETGVALVRQASGE